MATLYWRGAISSDVQIAANWTLIIPSSSTTAPPAAVTGPTGGDTVIFKAFNTSNAPNWNPIFSPEGIIGAGATCYELAYCKIENGFGRDIGSSSNFLKVCSTYVDLFKSYPNIDNTPSKVYLKGVKRNSTSPYIYFRTNYPIGTGASTHYIAGDLSGFEFLMPPSGGSDMPRAHANFYFGWEQNGIESIYLGISGGINSGSSSMLAGNLYLGKRLDLGSGTNIIRGNGLSTWIQRGASFDKLTVTGALRDNLTNYAFFIGATLAATGPIDNKTFINEFKVEGGAVNTNRSPNPQVNISAGVSFNNVIMKNTSNLTIDTSTNEYVYIKQGQLHTNTNKTPNNVSYYPSIDVSNDCLVIGASGEVGGFDIVSALGVNYDLPPSINVYPSSIWDIV
jgi:hypothetical protein